MEDFLIKFENLKKLSKISGDHALEILQLNVPWETMKSFVQLYGPQADYEGLKSNLQEMGHAKAYLKAIHHPTFTSFNCLCVVPPPTKPLLQGVPMEVDNRPSFRSLKVPFRGMCYNCGQAGHISWNCSGKSRHQVCVAPPFQDEVSKRREAIAQMQCELAAFEKGKQLEQLEQNEDEELGKGQED